MEGKREADARVAEEAAEISVDRLMRPEHREHLEQAHVEEVLPAEERRLEARLHPLRAWCDFHRGNGGSPGASPGAIAAICCSIRAMSGVAFNLAALAENDAILRIEPHHFHFLAERRAGRGENFFEDARVEEKRRTEIELEAVRFDRRRAAADRSEADRKPSLSLPPRRGEWPRPDRPDRRR